MTKKKSKFIKVPKPPKRRLPDIHTFIIMNRNKAIDSLKKGKVDPCYKALRSIIMLLPPAYRPKISAPRHSSKKIFTAWVWDTLNKIDQKMADFRMDNWGRKI